MIQSVHHLERVFRSFGASDEDVPQPASATSVIAVNPEANATIFDQMAGQAARVAWIDSYALTRDCILKVLTDLQPNLMVHPFASVEEFLAADETEVDVIILYSHRAFESSLQELGVIRDGLGETPVIMLSDLEEGHQVGAIRAALRAGASGFISTRSMGLGMTLSAIRFVQSGGTFAPLDILLSDTTAIESPQSPDDTPYKLTARQRDVLAQLQQGKANKIIAHELGMSESTAKVHIRNIMRKMGATNRTQAAFNALKLCPDSEARSFM
jgi:DNA-binding NarL/FixJ family response regulator